jgi:hypothetical protein
VACECFGCAADPWARNFRIPVAAGMDFRISADVAFALDVRAGVAVSGQAVMRLILAVFGIALALLLLWAILWIVAIREKD